MTSKLTLDNQKLEKILSKTKKFIRNERLALGLTQKEFAEFSQMKYATYRAFEQTGQISLENFMMVLIKLNKMTEYEAFLDGFEFDTDKVRTRIDKKTTNEDFTSEPIVAPSQKQIALDKQIFGEELFYSVENGHIYTVSNFISIILSGYDDKKMMLLIKYFGIERLKPYILKEKNTELLQMFNKHIAYMNKRGSKGNQ